MGLVAAAGSRVDDVAGGGGRFRGRSHGWWRLLQGSITCLVVGVMFPRFTILAGRHLALIATLRSC